MYRDFPARIVAVTSTRFLNIHAKGWMIQPIHPSTAKDEVEERLKQELQNTSFKEWKAAGFEPEKR